MIDSCINFNEDNSQEWFGHFVIAFRVEEEFSEVAVKFGLNVLKTGFKCPSYKTNSCNCLHIIDIFITITLIYIKCRKKLEKWVSPIIVEMFLIVRGMSKYKICYL